DWLQGWIDELKIDKPAFPWIMPNPLLISSLERAAQECKSVSLLRFLVDVEKQIVELKRVNIQRDNTTLAIQTLMNLSDNVPKLERELKRHLVKSAVMAWCLFFALLFLLLGTGALAWIQVVKELLIK